MERVVKVFRFDNCARALHRTVVHQDRTQQGLLDPNVVGGMAVCCLIRDCRLAQTVARAADLLRHGGLGIFAAIAAKHIAFRGPGCARRAAGVFAVGHG